MNVKYEDKDMEVHENGVSVTVFSSFILYAVKGNIIPYTNVGRPVALAIYSSYSYQDRCNLSAHGRVLSLIEGK